LRSRSDTAILNASVMVWPPSLRSQQPERNHTMTVFVNNDPFYTPLGIPLAKSGVALVRRILPYS